MMSKAPAVKLRTVSTYLALARWPNLLLLASIQLLAFSTTRAGSVEYIICIISMTACIAAAGYTINDIIDQKADLYNSRNNVLNAHTLTSRQATQFYGALIVLGFGFAGILGVQWSIHFLWIYPVTTFLLWAYSEYFKGTPMAGNLVVSIICGGAVLVVCYPAQDAVSVPDQILWLSAFAFVTTWIREIIKDLEDIPGDMKAGYRTLPIVSGVVVSKALGLFLIAVVLGGLFCSKIMPSFDEYIALVFWIAVIGILILAVYLILKARLPVDYHRISTLLKIAMLFGALTLVI